MLFPEDLGLDVSKTGQPRSEDSAPECQEAGSFCEIKQGPSHQHGQHGPQMTDQAGDLIPVRQDQDPFQHEEQEIIKAPDHEVEVGPMPKTGQKPDNQGIAKTVAFVAAQGDVDIVPEKGAEGDVPAPPEFRNGG